MKKINIPTDFTICSRVAIRTCARKTAQIVVGARGAIFALIRFEIARQDFCLVTIIKIFNFVESRIYFNLIPSPVIKS